MHTRYKRKANEYQVPIKAANRRRKKVVNVEKKKRVADVGLVDRGIQPPSTIQPSHTTFLLGQTDRLTD